MIIVIAFRLLSHRIREIIDEQLRLKYHRISNMRCNFNIVLLPFIALRFNSISMIEMLCKLSQLFLT